MQRVAVSGDGGDANPAVLIFAHRRFLHAAGAAPGGLVVGRFGVIHPQRDLANAIAMPLNMFGNFILRPKAAS